MNDVALISLILLLWEIVYLVQIFFSFGTAYRFTKRGGDNGIALFGWMLLFNFASVVPGLGFYFWWKYRDAKPNPNHTESANSVVPVGEAAHENASACEEQKVLLCRACGKPLPAEGHFCEHCGTPFLSD